jgi:hypothetical protein
MQQWDYHIEELVANEKVLKRLGQEGWELIAVHNGFGYFKRPIPIIIGPITIGPFRAENVGRERPKQIWCAGFLPKRD